MDLRVRTNGIDLATFQPLAGKNAQNLGGTANADVDITGSLEAPRFSGSAQLREATAKVAATNVTVTGGRADIRFTNQSITVEGISASADKGKLEAHGTIGMNQFKPGPLDLTLTMDNWPAIQTYRYMATIGTQLHLTGLATAPVLAGQLDVLNATIRPDLDFLGQQPIPKDETIAVVNDADAAPGTGTASSSGSSAAPPSAQTPPPAPASPSLFDAAAVDLAVVIHRNTWIKHQDLAQVELNGRVRVHKRPSHDLTLVGTVETVEGWLAFQGRRFNLTTGRIDFTGSTPIDPSLHVVAEYKPQGYTIDITVAGTASQPTLTLSSTPTLPQADILALVLFGKTTANLTKSDQASMQQQAATLATSAAARGIGQQVMTAMGLEDLGFSIEQVGSGTAVGYGKNLTENMRVTASQTVSGQKGQHAGFEYNLTPSVKITTSTSPRNNNQIGAEWHKRY
jgi:translocation and assembly module TamB